MPLQIKYPGVTVKAFSKDDVAELVGWTQDHDLATFREIFTKLEAVEARQHDHICDDGCRVRPPQKPLGAVNHG